MYSYIFHLIETIVREEKYMAFNRGMKSGQVSHISQLFYLRVAKKCQLKKCSQFTTTATIAT